MRRGWAIVAAIVGVLLVVAIAVGAYHAGQGAVGAHQIVEGGHPVVVGPAYGWHGGFFPFFPFFGFLFFPLIVIGVILLVRLAVGPRWGYGWGGPGHHGPWSDEGRARFEERFGEWHRRQHEQQSTTTDRGGGTQPTPPGGGTPASS